MKRFLKIFILIQLGLLLSQCATTRQKLTYQVLDINDDLNSLFKAKPEGFFFKHDFSSEKILFISYSEKLLFAMHKGEVAPLPFNQWEAKIPKSEVDYDIMEDQKRRILIIYLDKFSGKKEAILQTILHEGFHAFIQQDRQGWKKTPKTTSRGTIYPILNLPRYYRFEMQQSLIQYHQTGSKEYLQYFSYWFWKWRTNFLEEYRNYTDRDEGTAEYYSQVMMARHKLKETNPKSIYQYYRKTPMGRTDLKESFSLENESYHLGPLVGLALDQSLGSEWQEKVILGASPFDLLEKSILRKRKAPDQKTLNEFMRLSVREMLKIDKDGVLDKVITGLANPTTHRLILPSKDTQSTSFAATAMFRPFFNFKGLKDVQVIALGSQFSMENKKWKWQFQDGDYWVRTKSSPCSTGSGTVVVLKKENFEFKNGILKFKNQKPIKVKVKRRGHTTWYCAP